MPFQRRHALAGRHVPHLERVVARPRHDAPPVRKHSNLQGRHITERTQRGRSVPHSGGAFQRRHALTGRHVPNLEIASTTRNDAPPVRRDGDARDLRRSQIITKVQRTPQRTQLECPFSVATHLPVATSHTLSVLSSDPDTTRRPSGEIATQLTYDEARSSQKYSGRRNARNPSALSASAARRASTDRVRRTA